MSTFQTALRATLAGVALTTLAACHHRDVATSEYVGAADWGGGPTPAPSVDGPATTAPSRGNSSALGEVRSSRIEDLFAGRFAGLDVHRTGNGGISMRLRGVEPLLIVDGLEVDPVALVSVMPHSVRQIEVLRNVSDTAIYGSRGVNGVVVVTTGR